MKAKVQYEDGYWWSNDGLRLHYCDYAGPSDRPPIICIAGLTRNARDFEDVAARLAGQWRIICVDLRGRGESAYAKDSLTYSPFTYVQDLETLIRELKLERFILFGTSLGGIVSMLLGGAEPDRLAGLLLNDIGPDIEVGGLARIRTYVGRGSGWPTWVHAARQLAETNAAIYPRYDLPDWLRMAKQLNRVTASGRIVSDYDPKIADAFSVPAEPFDLWGALDLLNDVPSLIVRGAHSDILAKATVPKMLKRLRAAVSVSVENVGHAPTLSEPQSIRAINALLAKIV